MRVSTQPRFRLNTPKVGVCLAIPAFLWCVVACETASRVEHVDIPFDPIETSPLTVHSTVTSVMPWANIKTELQPDFDLSSDMARDIAIKRTGVANTSLINLLHAYISFGNLDGYKKQSSTSENGEEGRTASQLDQLTQQMVGVPPLIDPFLQYSVATALYQKVAVLNKYVEGLGGHQNYEPLFMQLQTSAIPFHRNLSYDVYTRISFFPWQYYLRSAQDEKSSDLTLLEQYTQQTRQMPPVRVLPKVIPLLPMNNITTTLRADHINSTGGITAGAAVQNVPVGAAVARQKEANGDWAFEELHSGAIVGKSGTNSLLVRIPARKNPQGEFKLVPRVYNLSLLLLVPKDLYRPGTRMSVRTDSFVLDPESGERTYGLSEDDVLLASYLSISRYARKTGVKRGAPSVEIPTEVKFEIRQQMMQRMTDGQKLLSMIEGDNEIAPINISLKQAGEMTMAVAVGDYAAFRRTAGRRNIHGYMADQLWLELQQIWSHALTDVSYFELPDVESKKIESPDVRSEDSN